MDLQTRKIEFVQEFLKIQSTELISRLEKMLKNEYILDSHFEPMSEKELNDRIDASMKDSENGKIIAAADLKARMNQWS